MTGEQAVMDYVNARSQVSHLESAVFLEVLALWICITQRPDVDSFTGELVQEYTV